MDGAIIFDIKEEGERATWRPLIRSQKITCGEINRRRLLASVLFCHFALSPLLSFCVIVIFYSVVLFIHFCRFVFPFRRFLLKRNKRATWRSPTCAK